MPKNTSKKKPSEKNDELSAEEVITLSAFESVKLTFEVGNTTTRTAVQDRERIHLVELQERGMTLEVPGRTCSQGHNLMIKIEAATPDKKTVSFNATARVDDLEPLPDTGDERITISLLQFDETGWKDFCKIFSSRQEAIQHFLTAARGY